MGVNKAVVFFLLFLCFQTINAANQTAQGVSICLLCPGNAILRPAYRLRGATCTQHATRIALTHFEGSSSCTNEKAPLLRACCTLQPVPPSEPEPVPVPKTYPNLPDCKTPGLGPFAKCSCDICSGGIVGNPSMVINMLYYGEGSCPVYYDFGREGNIRKSDCDHFQFFSREPCGCTTGGSTPPPPSPMPQPPKARKVQSPEYGDRVSLGKGRGGSGFGQHASAQDNALTNEIGFSSSDSSTSSSSLALAAVILGAISVVVTLIALVVVISKSERSVPQF